MSKKKQTADCSVEQEPRRPSDKLRLFLEKVYSKEWKSEPQYWKWKYIDNPQLENRKFLYVTAKQNNCIAGQLGTMPDLIVGRGVKIPIYWMTDLIVSPDFRRLGLAIKLNNKLAQEENMLFVLGMTSASRALQQQIGEQTVGRLKSLQALIGVRSILEMKGLPEFIVFLMDWFIRLIMKVYHHIRLRRWNNITCSVSRQIPLDLDELFANTSCDFFYLRRNFKILQWKFSQNPLKKFIYITARRHGRLVGFAVCDVIPTKKGFNRLRIIDLIPPGLSNDVLDALLLEVIAYASKEGLDFVSFFISFKKTRAYLHSKGWFECGNYVDFVIYKHHRTIMKQIFNIENWWLTSADADLSMFLREA